MASRVSLIEVSVEGFNSSGTWVTDGDNHLLIPSCIAPKAVSPDGNVKAEHPRDIDFGTGNVINHFAVSSGSEVVAISLSLIDGTVNGVYSPGTCAHNGHRLYIHHHTAVAVNNGVPVDKAEHPRDDDLGTGSVT